jgi:ribosomal protein S24E
MMSLRIIEHRKNPLMKRDEVKAVVEHAGKPTPAREEILSSLESVLKTSRDLIFIDKIFTEKGIGHSNLKVFVYGKKEDVHRQELQRAEKRKAKAAGEAKTEADGEKKEAKHEEHAEQKHEAHKEAK